MKNKINFHIFEIKKFLNKKGFTIKRKINNKKENNIGNISRTFLASLI